MSENPGMRDFDAQAEDLADAVERAHRMQAAADALGAGKPRDDLGRRSAGEAYGVTHGEHDSPLNPRIQREITYPEYGMQVAALWRFTFRRARVMHGQPVFPEAWTTAPTVAVIAKSEAHAEDRARGISPSLPTGVEWAFRLLSIEELR